MVGIYSIKNKINGKIYVGQSWNIKKRWSAHKGNKDKIQFKREHIYLAMNKYGIDNFEFSVLIEMDENVTQADLDFQEGLFIDFYKSSNREFGYNKRDAGSRGKHSVESREKMSRTRKGVSVNKGVPKSEEAKRNMSLSRPDITGNKNPMYGKKHSLATRLKLSEKAKKRIGNKNPFFGKKHTKETLEILRKNAVKQFGYRVICHNTNKIYNSMHEVGRDFSIDPRIISEICIGKKEDLNGYKFSFERG
jgi:group I intron endonuclease